jgi:hypothetical protein
VTGHLISALVFCEPLKLHHRLCHANSGPDIKPSCVQQQG